MTAEQVLTIARAELGQHESGGANEIKYNYDYWGRGGADLPWCVVFLWWCFRKAGVTFPNTAHCNGVRDYAKSVGRWVQGGYQPGDCVIYDYDGDNSGDHIGIVEAVNPDGTLTTIEGNYADSVARVRRRSNEIDGAYRPDYSGADASPTAPVQTVTTYSKPTQTMLAALPLLKRGHKGDAVWSLQTLLCTDADGRFGPETDKLVRAFQKEAGLEADGEVGALTWAKLIGG